MKSSNDFWPLCYFYIFDLGTLCTLLLREKCFKAITLFCHIPMISMLLSNCWERDMPDVTSAIYITLQCVPNVKAIRLLVIEDRCCEVMHGLLILNEHLAYSTGWWKSTGKSGECYDMFVKVYLVCAFHVSHKTTCTQVQANKRLVIAASIHQLKRVSVYHGRPGNKSV